MSDVPEGHPRYVSLRLRDTIVAGVESGVTSIHGLMAHGRGEAFDYLIGEKTQPFAIAAIRAGAATLVLAEHPVISVNGNVAALTPGELVTFSKVLKAPLEVNIFHTSKERESAIQAHLKKHGAVHVLMPSLNRLSPCRNYEYDVLIPVFLGSLISVDTAFQIRIIFGDKCGKISEPIPTETRSKQQKDGKGESIRTR